MWYFHAIAKHPEAQVRIRKEIALVRARAAGEEFSAADLDSMVYTLATLKVVSFFCAPVIAHESLGIDEARSHHLAKQQDSESGRHTSIGIPDQNQVRRTNYVNSHQEGDVNRYFSNRV